MAGFTAPGLLFAGNCDSATRAFYGTVFARLRPARYVELGVGSFAAALVAANAGIPATVMETSDVTLYSSIVGYHLAGRDLTELAVALDGEPVKLPDADSAARAAHLLWTQLWTRTAVKAGDYWRYMLQDLEQRRDEHEAAIAERLRVLAQRLPGIRYEARDMFDVIEHVADDPGALIIAAPPSYRSGFEKFFDTDGRLVWAEPPYRIFDPATDYAAFLQRLRGAAALLLFMQEDQTGAAVHEQPVFAYPLSPGRTAYAICNRPGDIFAVTGRARVLPRRVGDIQPADMKTLHPDHDIRPDSTIELLRPSVAAVDYYRSLWAHRIHTGTGGAAFLVLIDGRVAGVVAYSANPMTRSRGNGGNRWNRYILLQFGYAAPHHTLRLSRLMTMLAASRQVASVVYSDKLAVRFEGSLGLITTEITRHPESKSMRGLMRLLERRPHPDGFRLIYQTPWSDLSPGEVLRQFLAKEDRWRQTSTKGQPSI